MADIGTRVILIGGTSHVGKSTLAQHLASVLGWPCLSTDRLARHPGRPWGTVHPHVAEHYLSLSPDELLENVLRHYGSMWPGVRDLITAHTGDDSAEPLILEGSALWPESVATLRLACVRAVWLTASERFIAQRIRQNSGYEAATAPGKILIEKFIARSQRYNRRMMQVLHRLGLPVVSVEEVASLEELSDRCLSILGGAR